mmetsp:Transcript_574/g.958  ORF Transcript_574/g.958 Transcript_574/m.958 type:complete len:483 (+) Transcript_574:307-1755(+)
MTMTTSRQLLFVSLALFIAIVAAVSTRADTGRSLLVESSCPSNIGTGAVRPGFNSILCGPNDDCACGPPGFNQALTCNFMDLNPNPLAIPLGFNIRMGTVSTPNVFVNTNGNIMLTSPLRTFTPFALDSSLVPILAGFFADVDTRGDGNFGNVVKYGYGTVDGLPSFGVTWDRVDYFIQSSAHGCNLNTFQIIISSTNNATGNVCVEYNYNKIVWETGTASNGNAQGLGGSSAVVGYTTGPGGSVQFVGSLVPGSFLDSGSTPLKQFSSGTSVPGRIRFCITNGVVQTPCNPNPCNGGRCKLSQCGFTCECSPPETTGANGICQCPPPAMLVGGVCTCPSFASLINGVCVCPANSTSNVAGGCTALTRTCLDQSAPGFSSPTGGSQCGSTNNNKWYCAPGANCCGTKGVSVAGLGIETGCCPSGQECCGSQQVCVKSGCRCCGGVVSDCGGSSTNAKCCGTQCCPSNRNCCSNNANGQQFCC